MNKDLKHGMAAAIGLSFLAATSGGAQESRVPESLTFIPEMGTELYIFSDTRDGDAFTIERGSYDHAVGVYCEWKATGEKSYETIKNLRTGEDISRETVKNVEMIESECQLAAPPVTDPSTIVSADTLFTNPRMVTVFNAQNQTVTESFLTGPNHLGVISENRRAWDFDANQVCLTAKEGIIGQDPYISQDEGCYEIPKNAHTDNLREELATFGRE